jgi:hypothetical protein
MKATKPEDPMVGDGGGEPGAPRRARFAGITPLAVAGFEIEGRRFEYWLGSRRGAASLRQMLAAWRERRLPLPAALADDRAPEAVYLTGGRSLHAQFARLSEIDQLPVIHATDPMFAGALAGQRWLDQNRSEAWVLDLGQTAAKVVVGERRWRFVRNFTALPVAADCRTPRRRREQKFALRNFLGDKLNVCRRLTGSPPRHFLFGVCAQLGDDLVPHGSSYAGLDGQATFFSDVLRRGRLRPDSVWAANDAELAALAALEDARLARWRRVLVLTLGFSVGGAVIDR